MNLAFAAETCIGRSIWRKILALSEDQRSRRFLSYSALFMVLIAFSCYVEEFIFKALPGFEFYWAVALVELSLFAVWGGACRWYSEGLRAALMKRAAPLWAYFAFAFFLAFSQSLGKLTYAYMNYATGTIVKSAKLVPTLALSALWLHRPVSTSEWLAAGLLVTSSAFMALGEHLADVNFNPFGLVIAALQLLAAASQGNVQERILKDYDASISEAMFFGNSLGAVIVFAVMIVKGELEPATVYFIESPFALLLLVIRSVTFLLGALALNVLTKEYGTGAATTVGTGRKSLTLLVSFALFPKPFHINYVIGLAAFLGADFIYLHTSSQKAALRNQDQAKYKQVDNYDLPTGADNDKADSGKLVSEAEEMPECIGHALQVDTV